MWPFKDKPKWRLRPGTYVRWILEERRWWPDNWTALRYYEDYEEAKEDLKKMETQGIL